MALKKSFKEWNEVMVRRYNPEDYIFRSNSLVRFIELKRFQKIKESLQLTNDDDFLDIGCGSGYLLDQAICNRGVGVDISDLMVKTARENCKDKIGKIVIQSDGERLPLRNRSFNKIVSTEVIEHILHPQILLEEISRVAKDNALIVITIPHERFINWIKNLLFSLHFHKLLFRKSYHPSRKMEDEWHLHVFDVHKFKELIKGLFIIEDKISIPIVFFPLRYVFSLRKHTHKDV